MKEIIRNLSQKYLENNQPSGWFEELYTLANHNPEKIPWALSEGELGYFISLGFAEKNRYFDRLSPLSTNVLCLELMLGISD